jgi:hypothetical protein
VETVVGEEDTRVGVHIRPGVWNVSCIFLIRAPLFAASGRPLQQA